jgi:hypothetical protein
VCNARKLKIAQCVLKNHDSLISQINSRILLRTSDLFSIYKLAVFPTQSHPNTPFFLSPFYFLLTYDQALPSGRFPSGLPSDNDLLKQGRNKFGGEILLEKRDHFS